MKRRPRPDTRVHFRVTGGVPACLAPSPEPPAQLLYATDPAFPFRSLVLEGVTCGACLRTRAYRHYDAKARSS